MAPPRLGQGSPGGRRALRLGTPLTLADINQLGSPLRMRDVIHGTSLNPPLPLRSGSSRGGLTPQQRATLIRDIYESGDEWSNKGLDRLIAGSGGHFEKKELAKFERMNVPPEALTAVRDVLQEGKPITETRKHGSVLGFLGDAIGITETIGSAFVLGADKYEKKHDIAFTDYFIHPSHLYKSTWGGFKEVNNVLEDPQGMTYAEMLRETSDPHSFSYRFANPIGLGMAILFDPLTYMSFGATSVSKTAAYHVLAQHDKEAYAAAELIIKRGGTTKTIHGEIPANYDNLDEIASSIKAERGLAFTTGDALTALREQGLQIKQEIREGGRFYNPQTGEWQKASVAQTVGAHAMRANVKGGRGIRFAGYEIPGTPELGTKWGDKWTRAVAGSEAADAIAHAMVPAWGGRHVMGDGLRASALVEMARYKADIQRTRSIIGRDVRQLHSVVITDPEERAAANIVGSHEPIKVKPHERVGIFEPYRWLSPQQKKLRQEITHEVEFAITKAEESGLHRTRLEDDWNFLKDTYDDPLEALAEFKFKTTTKVLSKRFIEKTLKDRRFSIPLHTKAEIREGHIGELPVDPPHGFGEMHFGGRRYAVRHGVLEAIRDIRSPAVIDTQMKRGLQLLSAPQNWWKLYATSPNPAFHVMNFLGAVWNNSLAAIYNPNDYVKAAATLYRGRKEEAAQVGSKFGPLRRVPESTPAGQAAQAHLAEAEARGGLGRGSFLWADVSRGHYTPQEIAADKRALKKSDPQAYKEMQAEIAQERGPVERMTHPRPGASKREKARFYGITTPRRAAGAAALATGNPLAALLFAPELAKVGKRFGGTIEDLVRLAPFSKYSSDPQIARLLHEYGPITINGARHPGWTKDQQQIMYDIGAHISKHFQFDYTELTGFERYIAKTIFPFWTYYKKNFMLQAKELIKQPRQFEAAVRVMNYINDEGQELGPYEGLLPNYFNNIEAFQVPVPNFARTKLGLPENQPLYLNPKMPFLSLNMFPPLWNIINDPNTPTSQKILESFAPVFGAWGPYSPLPLPFSKVLLEAGTGHNLGLNRPIDYQRVNSNDFRNSYVPMPGWMKFVPAPIRNQLFHPIYDKKRKQWEITATSNYVAEQMATPFVNNLGHAIGPQGASKADKAKARANTVSWLTGVRLIPVDILRLDRNNAYTIKNVLESKQSELRQQGKELNNQDRELLWRVKKDLKIINFYYDQRFEDTIDSGGIAGRP